MTGLHGMTLGEVTPVHIEALPGNDNTEVLVSPTLRRGSGPVWAYNVLEAILCGRDTRYTAPASCTVQSANYQIPVYTGNCITTLPRKYYEHQDPYKADHYNLAGFS